MRGRGTIDHAGKTCLAADDERQERKHLDD